MEGCEVMGYLRMYTAAARKYLLLIATAFIFFMFPLAQSANAATIPFSQGKGYQQGAYQKYADQPTASNWDRQSKFKGSTIPAVKWTFKSGDDITASPVIDKDGTVYVGSEDGNLYAVKSDGKVKWKYKTEEGISASPAIASDGTIYVTSGMTLYAVSSSGKRKWSYTIPAEQYSSLWLNSPPAIGKDGTVYVGVSGFFENGGAVVAKGRLLAIGSNGKLKWEYKGNGSKSTSSIDSTPAIAADGTIYVTDTYYSRYGDFVSLSGNIHAVTPTGKQKWMYEIGSYTDASPVIGADGTVYVGSEDDYLYAFYKSSGLVKWKLKTGGDIVGGAAIDKNGMIYVGSRDGKLYAVEPKKGKVQWAFQAQDGIKSTPLVDASGVIYFGSDDSYVYALNSKDGALKWKASTGGAVDASPAISQKGDIYISSRDSKLYAFNMAGKSRYSVSGQVIDSKTKKPISGATVMIAGQKKTTDTKGRFALQGIPASSYAVIIEKKGFYTYTNNSFVVSKNVSNKSFSLMPGGKLTVKPSKGVAHTKITIGGTGFPIDESGSVFLDKNKNGVLDGDEESVYARTSLTGSFSDVSITVPDLAAAQYPILYTSDTVAKDPISVNPAMFTVLPSTAKMKANVKEATPHVKVTISGSGFAVGERGKVYFDTNKNKKFDWDEPSQYIYDMPKGSFSDVVLSIPNVKAGTYPIAFESNIGPLKVQALSLTVKSTPAKLAVTPGSGSAGNSFTVSGTSFPAGESGSVYLDVNKNGKYDYSTDPSTYVYADDKGKFTSSSMTVPDAPAGSYKVLFQASWDSLNAAPAVFKITPTAATMKASPTKGGPFTTITVSGTLFPPNFSGYVYFDTNKDGTQQYTEPYASVYTSSSGAFESTLNAPSAAPGTYHIRFQASSGKLTVPSIPFTLQKSSAALSLSPSTAVPHSTVTVKGTKLPANDYGQVFVDVNNNGKYDYDGSETYVSVSADSNGVFSGTLGIPDATPKKYNVRYQSSKYSDLQLSSTVTITSSKARLKSASAAVNRGNSVAITGTGFPKGESGFVYVDMNGNGKRDYYDPSEPSSYYVYADDKGGFQTTLNIGADAAPGKYVVRYESSSSYGPLKVPTIPLQIN